jgi:hypothetical protein
VVLIAFPIKTGDRRLKGARYLATRAELKRRSRAVGAPCARCRCAIDYDGPYWLTDQAGRKRVNPRAFVAGHIVDRVDTDDDTLANLQPECARCSARSGARRGHAQRFGRTKRTGYSDPRW